MPDYKAAYERQKKAREQAEALLENRSRELYDANESLKAAYNKLKDQKSQMLHQEKLASIGQLSAGIAHEVNNPVGYIKSNLSTLEHYIKAFQATLTDIESLDDSQAFKVLLGEITKRHDTLFSLEDSLDLLDDSHQGIARIQDIIGNLKRFSRNDSGQDYEYDINDVVRDTVKLVQNDFKTRIQLNLSLTPVPLLLGQANHIAQVILNFIVNASHAIEGTGTITISSRSEQDSVVVSICDDGCGIAEQDRLRIFDPFFTTKDVGAGTGLGLSVSHGIIKSHGGRIAVDSTEGEGSTFTVYLPVKR